MACESLSLKQIELALSAHQPDELDAGVAPERAAVAALLRFRDGPEVLLMKRVERENDRWSGQVSFPGGRAERGDADLLATAIRETREEVGLHLDHSARLLGRLDDLRARAREGALPLAIRPFVFAEQTPSRVRLSDEAEDVLWLPLERVQSGVLSGVYEFPNDPERRRFPCWRYQGHVVWGLTYMMITGLLSVVAPTS